MGSMHSPSKYLFPGCLLRTKQSEANAYKSVTHQSPRRLPQTGLPAQWRPQAPGPSSRSQVKGVGPGSSLSPIGIPKCKALVKGLSFGKGVWESLWPALSAQCPALPTYWPANAMPMAPAHRHEPKLLAFSSLPLSGSSFWKLSFHY